MTVCVTVCVCVVTVRVYTVQLEFPQCSVSDSVQRINCQFILKASYTHLDFNQYPTQIPSALIKQVLQSAGVSVGTLLALKKKMGKQSFVRHFSAHNK